MKIFEIPEIEVLMICSENIAQGGNEDLSSDPDAGADDL